jgi:predicted nucleotidyltransferase
VIPFTPDERDEIARRLLELLREDERVASAELSGSGATGYTDRWSDLDIVVRAAEGADHRKLADSWSAKLYEHFPVVHDFGVTFDVEHVRGFLLENYLEIDLGFQPAAGRTDPETWCGPMPQAEAGFTWHDVLHAGIAIRRGHRWRAGYYVGLLRWRTIQLAAVRHGVDTSEFKGVDDLPAELLAELELAVPSGLTTDELTRALRAVIPLFFAQLRTFDAEEVKLADKLEPHLLAFVEEIA